MIAKMVAKIEKRLERIEARVRRIEKELEMGGMIVTFDWKDFSQRDKQILNCLLQKGQEGSTTTEIASAINLNSPETGGRTIIYERLKRIKRISSRLKGAPIVIMDRKRWFLNFQEFDFVEEKNLKSTSP